ncbi:hypothetical protein DUNSADRAFT_1356 [Dunaliella salina]|uniref:Uncharacterized protein n=1 Tax=Dunaliella salina TaxID=3046 RepID=A0ABQ7GX86_DUNSA|nr:hypothetical protein DUNSADRAFT_1356 [Dunaliella salina]|eukprot:KAF5839220.1 hypothetical protein DUNSADRAFT_1356 [Dunaliella salina]
MHILAELASLHMQQQQLLLLRVALPVPAACQISPGMGATGYRSREREGLPSKPLTPGVGATTFSHIHVPPPPSPSQGFSHGSSSKSREPHAGVSGTSLGVGEVEGAQGGEDGSDVNHDGKNGRSASSGSSSGVGGAHAMFLPLMETVADALLPALPDLSLCQLSALGQQAWELLTATNSNSAGSSVATNTGGVGDGGVGSELVGGGVSSGLPRLAAVHGAILELLVDKMQELYLLPADTISASLHSLVAARLCTPSIFAVAADALAWQLADTSPTTLSDLLLAFMNARAQATGSNGGDSAVDGMTRGPGGPLGDRGLFGSNLFVEEYEHSMSSCSHLDAADAFVRELLGLLEPRMDQLTLQQVYGLVVASTALRPYQRRRLFKQAAKVLRTQAGGLQPQQCTDPFPIPIHICSLTIDSLARLSHC